MSLQELILRNHVYAKSTVIGANTVKFLWSRSRKSGFKSQGLKGNTYLTIKITYENNLNFVIVMNCYIHVLYTEVRTTT